jgi:murein DD-endopeptidase MepM/ murein hydrolase activator NlpD
MQTVSSQTRQAPSTGIRLSVLIVALCFAAPAAAAPLARSHSLTSQTTLHVGRHGAAVRELQLALAWHGFPSGAIDGRFGLRVAYAVRRFQRAAGLHVDGKAGPATIALLRGAPRRAGIPLGWPLLAPVGDSFGPRGNRFHAGIDLPAPAGTAIIAAAPGVVTWAAPRAGGWGNLVTIAHPDGVRTMYAHLSTIRVHVGEWVAGGTIIGRVGSTGDATGPHLHFEVRVDGAAIDPLGALVTLSPGT